MAFIVIFNGFILAYAAQMALIELEKLQDRFDRVTDALAASNSETQKLRKGLETMQSQFKLMSVTLNEVENRSEPIVAFRAIGIKNDQRGDTTKHSKPPGISKCIIICVFIAHCI